jgi:hypothetical protein
MESEGRRVMIAHRHGYNGPVKGLSCCPLFVDSEETRAHKDSYRNKYHSKANFIHFFKNYIIRRMQSE